MKEKQNSEWHRLKKNEILHFYKGAPLIIFTQTKNKFKKYILGKNTCYNLIIKKGTWFDMKSTGKYSLIGCTVSPSFKFSDLEIYSIKNKRYDLPKI